MRRDRRFLLAMGLALPALPRVARAEQWPARPIRVVVAWPAGGGVDTPTRLIAPVMGRLLGQPLVLDNRGGASGTIGEAEAARAAPDGYTLLATGNGMATNNMLLPGLPYDTEASFTPVSWVVSAPLLLVVRADSPARDLAGLVAMLREAPGRLSYFSSGAIGGTHMTSLMLLRRVGASAVHVPYRGGSQSIAGMMGGDTDFGFSTLPQAVPLVREGRLRALGVSSPVRMPSMPEVPTVAEQGFPGFERAEGMGFWVPAGVPGALVARLQQAVAAALAEPALRARLEAMGMVPVGSTPGELAAMMVAQREMTVEMIRVEGLRVGG